MFKRKPRIDRLSVNELVRLGERGLLTIPELDRLMQVVERIAKQT